MPYFFNVISYCHFDAFFYAQRLGNGRQGFPKKLIENTSFKGFSIFKKKEPLAVRFTLWVCAYF
jgi:hypothetical protein